MAQNTKRVIIPGNGRFWLGPVDTPPPGQLVTVTGGPTSAVLTFTVGGTAAAAVTVSPLTLDADCLEIAQTIAALAGVGAGRVSVLPASLTNFMCYLIFIDPIVTSQTITVAGTFTAGTTPAVTVQTTAVGLGAWTPYTEVGLTSKDSPLQFNRTGGDTTVLDAWQQSGVASTVASTQYSMAYSLLQYDYASMKLYHGSNAVVGTNGMLQTSQSNPTPTENSLLLQILNGSTSDWRHFPRVSTIAADGENFDVAKLAGMPVASTVLASSTYPFGQQIGQTGAAA